MSEQSAMPATAPGGASAGQAGEDAGARAAIARVLLQYRAAMITAEAGVIDDRDIEALHDFRVAIRRSRSLLKTLGQHFDADAMKRFRDDFAWLAKATGRQRDLDVLLSQLEEQQRILGVDEGSLKPIRTAIKRRRAAARAQLLRVFASPRYRGFKVDWFHYLDAVRHDSVAEQAVRDAVSAAVRQSWQQVRKRGDSIRARSKMERLHALRKDCKVLRYLLEGFGQWYPAEDVDRLTRALKKLQDVLGAACDLNVQMQMLSEIATAVRNRRSAPATNAALGAWRRSLRKSLAAAREKFAASYARFMRKRHRRLFKSLFAEVSP